MNTSIVDVQWEIIQELGIIKMTFEENALSYRESRSYILESFFLTVKGTKLAINPC